MIGIKISPSRWCRGAELDILSPVPLFRFVLPKECSRWQRTWTGLSHETSSELEEVHGRKKRAGKPWPAWDKSSADVAHNPCVRLLEGRLAVARLAVSVFAIRFSHIPRNAAFGFAASPPTAPFLPFFLPFFLSLSLFLNFLGVFLFPPSLVVSFLFYLFFPCTSPPLAFRVRCFFVHQTMDIPDRPACVSGLRLCFLWTASRSSLRLPTL